MRDRDVLSEAAELIRERGFCQRRLHDPNGCLCVLGAILTVLGISTDDDWDEEKENLSVVRGLSAIMGGNWASLSNWNDKKGRTKEEAIKFLQDAAADESWDIWGDDGSRRFQKYVNGRLVRDARSDAAY